MNRRVLLLAPLALAGAAGAGSLALLQRMRAGTYDPHAVPSPLLGHRVPAFTLAGQSGEGFGQADIVGRHRPLLINFFASWCAPCIEEAPVLMQAREADVPLWGIAYKDEPDATAAFLVRNGNPYERIARDPPGRVAIDWGVTGVPETFLIDAQGVVRWHIAEPMTAEVLTREVEPLLRKYV